MKKVEKGKFVKVEYTGTLGNGDVFDSNKNAHPIEIEVGAGKLIKGFEDALVGMEQNEKKNFTLSPEEGYGKKNEELEQTFSRSELPDGFEPQVGQVLALHHPEGGQIPAKVKHADAENITVDLNHPLAGETLTFDIEILEINDEATQPVCNPSTCSTCGPGTCG